MMKVDWIIFAVVLSLVGAALIVFTNKNKKKSKKASHSANAFDEDEVRDVFNKIVELINEEQYYLNKNLKLSDLANELHGNDRLVSRAINTYGHANFNKFINSFRVQHSKEILVGGKFDHYTIEAIADESGFSNKVSFYNAFKSETGMSPTQFRALEQSKN